MKNRNVLLTVAVFLGMTFGLTAQNVPSYVPTNGLVGWWPFNGNANDESGNGNNGTVNGATLTADRFEIINKSYEFNQTGDKIVVQNSNQLQLTNSFSIAVWVKPTNGTFGSGPNYFSIIQKWGPFFDASYLLGLNLEGKPLIVTHDGDNSILVGKNALPFNSWTLIVYTQTGEQGTIFTNGEFDSTSSSMNIPMVINNPLLVASNDVNNLGWNGDAYEGVVDDIAIYNRSLTQQEIRALYQGGNTTSNCLDLPSNLQQGLVGYWPFCGNANDESGNGNNGTVNGATLTADRFGNDESSYNFNGSSFIDLGDSINLNVLSISAWINSTDLSAQQGIISQLRDWGGFRFKNFHFYIESDSSCGIHFGNGIDYNTTPSSGSGFISPNLWYHLAVSRTQDSAKLYLNGVLRSKIATLNYVTYPNPKTYIGARVEAIQGQSGTFFKGKIDDVAIWNRALTQQEITQLYNQGICKTSITVTDTLLIHTGITSYNPVAYQNTLKVWPNPGNQEITIDAGNLASMQGWKIRVSNAQGLQIYPSGSQSGLINQQQQTLDMSGWGGNGLYFLYLIDPQNNIQEVKKIVLAP